MNMLSEYMDKDTIYLENEWSKIETLIKLQSLEYNQNIRDCEARVFTEGGDVDDLEKLYTEADQKAKQQNKGILSRIAGWFENMFQKILDFLTKILTGANRQNQQEMVPYDQGLDDRVSDAKSIIAKLKEVATSVTKSIYGKILGTAIAVIAPIVARTYINHKIKMVTKDFLNRKVDNARKTFGDLKNAAGSALSAITGTKVDMDESVEKPTTLWEHLRKWVQSFWNFIIGSFGNKNNNNQPQQQNTESSNNQNDTQ